MRRRRLGKAARVTEDGLETLLRSVGGLLQLGGFILTALGVTSARRRWAPQRGILNALGRFADRLFAKRPASSGGSVADVRPSPSARGLVSFRLEDPPGTLDQRVEVLERRLTEVQQRTGELRDALAAEVERRADGEEAHREALAASERRIDQDLSELAAGNLRQEAIGVLLFTVGVTLATWSQEAASLLP
jgi:hypothetical protein